MVTSVFKIISCPLVAALPGTLNCDIPVTDDVEMEEKQFIALLNEMYYPSL